MGLLKKMRKRKSPPKPKPEPRYTHASPGDIIRLYANNERLIGSTIDDFFMMAKIALNRAFGFGQIRWNRIHRKMLLDLTCIGERYVTVKEINQALREEADFGFNAPDRKHWTYERKVAATVCDDMSSCFALALLDEFGFKAKRIAKAYDMMGQIGNDLKTGKLSRKEFVRLASGGK